MNISEIAHSVVGDLPGERIDYLIPFCILPGENRTFDITVSKSYTIAKICILCFDPFGVHFEEIEISKYFFGRPNFLFVSPHIFDCSFVVPEPEVRAVGPHPKLRNPF